jgi:hypothetical protein
VKASLRGILRTRTREDGTICDGGEHQGEGIATASDRHPTQAHAGNSRPPVSGVGQPRRRRNVEIDHPRDNRHRFVGQLLNPEAAHLEKPGEDRRRTRDQAVVDGLHLDAIVGDEACKGEVTGGRSLDQLEHEPRLAGARRSANEKGPRPHQNHRGVNGGDGVHEGYVIAGSRTRKRAPRMRSSIAGLAPGSRGATRFCASSRPPWASTICFEMNRPSPEF